MVLPKRGKSRRNARGLAAAAENTGPAIALDGGWANSGSIINFVGGRQPSARSQYSRQVETIAPADLQDRAAQLEQLAAFCTAPDEAGSAYAWWRAPAWSGKSALMAWFALHPPEGVRIVPFFITSRWGGYSDWRSFTDIVSEQLAELLDEPRPTDPRAPDLWDLLDRAAQACAGRGQRLVLLIDGLDEDRGVTKGHDAHSIAALLPARPAAGTRVIVSGRLNPPIPFDVGADHPLRDPAIVRELEPSPAAQVVREDMERELRGLREGSRVERDLLGLIAAARGGLSAADLAELTAAGATAAEDLSTAQIRTLLATVAGRSFVPRPSRWLPGTEWEGYVLGHEELQRETETYFGDKGIERYRDRLHIWADSYRDRGWPSETPHYLLQIYPQMLQSSGGLTRLVELAADTRRHSRMRQATGGDGLALTEIATAQQALMATDPPDVAAVARLAVHRQSLTRRGAELPAGLPAVWARIGATPGREGDFSHAKEIAHSFTDPARRCLELLGATRALEKGDEHERATAFTDDALSAALQITEPDSRAGILAAVAETYGRRAAADQTRAIIGLALTTAEAIGDRDRQEDALGAVAAAAAAIGQTGTALRIATSLTIETKRTEALQRAAQSAAAAGDLGGADTFLAAIDLPNQRAWALGGVIHALAQAEFTEGARDAAVRALSETAQAAARDIPELEWRAHMLGEVAHALARVGDDPRARRFVRLAENAIRRVPPSQNAKPEVPVAVACALIILGDVDEGLTIARSGDSSGHRAAAAAALARAGRPDEAEALVSEIDEPAPRDLARKLARGPLADLGRRLGDSAVPPRLNALVRLAHIAADAGDTDRAIRLCEQIGPATALSAVGFLKETTPTDIACALAAARYTDEALEFAGTISDHGMREQALLGVARAAHHDEHAKAVTAIRSWANERHVAAGLAMVAATAATAGDSARAAALAEESAALAEQMDDSLGPVPRFEILTTAARAMAAIGDHERAYSFADLLAGTESLRTSVLFAASAAATDAGHLDSAEHLALTLDHPSDRAGALAYVAQAAAHAGHRDRALALAQASAAEPLGTARPTTSTTTLSGPGFAVAAVSEVLSSPDGRARAIADIPAASMAGFVFEPVGEEADATTEARSGPRFTAFSATIPAMSEDPRTEVSAVLCEVFAGLGDQARARTTADAILATARTIHAVRHRSDALGHAARAMAACGQIDLALSIADEAMTVAADITSGRKRNAAERSIMRARALIALAAAKHGATARARAIAEGITEKDIRAAALTESALALVAAGDEAAAIDFARSCGDPLKQATALAAVAETLTGARAQDLLGQALQVGGWEPCLTSLVKIAPEAVAAIAAEVSLFPAPAPAESEPAVVDLFPEFGGLDDSELWSDGDEHQSAAAEQAVAMLRSLADRDELLGIDGSHPASRVQRRIELGYTLISARRYAEALEFLAQALLACQREPVEMAGTDTLADLLEHAYLGANATVDRHDDDTAPDDRLARPLSTAVLRARIAGLSKADAGRLADALGDTAVGIFQAAAHLAGTDLPVGDYLNRLDTRAAEIRGEGQPGSAAAATSLAVEDLAREAPDAADLIRLCAYFAPSPIPFGLLVSAAKLPGRLAVRIHDPDAWAQTADQLQRRALARVDQDGLLLHRLTQAAVRDHMPRDQAALAQTRAEQVLLADAPDTTDDPADWPVWAALRPHALAAERASARKEDLRDLARSIAWYLLHSGDIRAGHDLAAEMHARWSGQLGRQDDTTLDAASVLAYALRRMGRYADARPLNADILSQRRRSLGPDHNRTLQAANDLAIDLRRTGELREARAMDEDTLARRKRISGHDDPQTLISASNLALDLQELGEWQAAKKLNEDTLARRKHVLGRDHPDTLASASNLAYNLRLLGKPKAARKLNEDAVARRRRVLGDDHPDTLASAGNLADNLRALGELQAARELDEDTLARRRRVLPDDHPDIFLGEDSLAEDLFGLEDFAAARLLGEDIVAGRRRVFGDDHLRTLEAVYRLGIATRRAGEPQAARVLNEDTLAKCRRALGDDHELTLNVVNSLANDLFELDEFQAAAELNEDNLARWRRLQSDDSPGALVSAHNLANCWYGLGKLEAARELHEQTLTRRRAVLGADHPHTINTAARLAADLRGLGERRQARELTEDILAAEQRTLGANHPDTLVSASNLIMDLHELGEFQQARELGEDLLSRLNRTLGEDDPHSLTAAAFLAVNLYDLGDLRAAFEMNERALIGMRQILGEDDPRTLDAATNLAEIEQAITESQRPH